MVIAVTERKSDRSRSAIMESALDFLWSHRFREMTVGDVMRPTGRSRSAFYQYFRDLHELMEALLEGLQDEILAGAAPWIEGAGESVELLDSALSGLVTVCYRRGPILRAVADASTADERLEKSWKTFLGDFDEVVSQRIAADQERGLIPDFDPMPVAVALNRLDASLMIDAFGQRPRKRPEPVLEAVKRIWISTLYGQSHCN